MKCIYKLHGDLMIVKTLKVLIFTCLLSVQMFALSTVHAKSGGGAIAGGGGDASEERVNEIRSDILSWITKGGAVGLDLSAITYSEYFSKMSEILEPQKVIVGFVENDDSENEELKVSVDGNPKTCRGFISKVDLKDHILCNISRFKNSSDSEQYKLIHHEFAGLVNVENNEGAASDYVISTQITDYLRRQTVLKLAINKQIKKTENVVPSVVISKSKYIGDGSFEVTMAVINTQDVKQVVLEDGIPRNYELDGCQPSLPNLTFTEEQFEKTFILKKTDCRIDYRFIRFETTSVEYKDGTIKPFSYLKFSYVPRENGLVTNVETKNEVLSEKIESFIPDSFKNKSVKRKTKEIKFTYKTTAENMNNYKGVIFSDGEEFFTDDAFKLAEVINNKNVFITAIYEEEYSIEYKCFPIIWFCYGTKEVVKKDKFKIKNFGLSSFTLIKKNDLAEFETSYVSDI